MNAQNFDASGIILINKPRKMSSFSVVNFVKKTLGAKKAGHLGTLDVEAEGLLPVAINSAVKLFDHFLKKDKTYTTKIKFGEKSNTFDLEGEIEKVECKKITKKMLEEVLSKFTGEQNQLPPSYSAKKVNGKRAYQLALKGEEVVLQPKKVTIYSIKVLRELSENFFELEVSCSAGTYIRALARDLAAEFSTYGVCYDIIRTRCGNFQLKDAFTLDDLKAGKFHLITPETLFDYPIILVEKENSQKLLNGAKIFVEKPDGCYKIYSNVFLGIGKIEKNFLKLETRLF